MIVTSTSSLRAQGISVLSFGAVPDGILRTDGVMSAGSSALTSASGTFTSSDVGKYIQVIGAGPGGTSHSDGAMSYGSTVLVSPSGTFASSDIGRGIVVLGAGPGGGNLVSTIQSYSSPSSVTLNNSAQSPVAHAAYYYGAMTLEGIIQSVQNNTTAILSVPAAAAISGAMFAYGTENHTAFQTAVDAAGQSGGGVVNVPAPSTCPAGAVCGYVVKATDQMTAIAPGAVKIRYNNVSLVGSAPQTNLFCRGAYGTYSNTAAFPGTTGNIRGFCLTIGDNGGPNGTAGQAVSNVTISNLHLYGMTNGNTYNNNFGYPPQSPTGDGWDITHKGIYMWDNSSFSNITVNSVIIQDFKAENIYSGGSVITGMVIENCTMTNFNGNGISMLAADLQVLNNTISNGSNAAVENSTVSMGNQALVRQLYQGNTISRFPREGIVVVGVDDGVTSGSIQILNNTFDTIAQANPSGTQSAIYIASQNNQIPPANVTVTGNTCHDCYSFGVFETSGNTLIQGNNFLVDQYNAGNVFTFTYAITNTTIANNTGSATANAISQGHSIGSVYQINPGFASGSFPWKNVVLKGNTWTFPGAPQYQFVTNSGLGWNLVTADNLNWQGDICNQCTHADLNHGLVDLSQTNTIEPYGPAVYVTDPFSPVSATVDARKQEDGSQIQVVNVGPNSVSFVSDGNFSLPGTVTLPGGSNSSITFLYSAALGKFSLPGGVATISATSGTPQSVTVNTTFAKPLQVTVIGANNAPLSGVNVTFSAPTSGASATFNGLSVAFAVTGSNGVATAPSLVANNQAGGYSVIASANGIATTTSFSLTNTAAPSGGSLTGSGNSSTATVNLTSEGGSDWIHWGDSSVNRKSTGNAQFSSYATVGSGSVLTYNNDPRPVGWSDGTPTSNSSNNANGIYIIGIGQGFSFTAPADTTTRTVVVHVGGWFSGGTFTAHLSDSSAPDFTDTTQPATGQYDRNYTLTYHASRTGQTLIISWMMTSGASYGNVTLNAATLAGSSVNTSAGTPQSTSINTAFSTALQVTIVDGNGNPVSGANVSFTAPSSGATATFGGSFTAVAISNANGVATAPTLTANSQVGSYAVTANVTGIGSVTFNLTNIAGVPAAISVVTGTPQTANINAMFGVALQVVVTDSGGNPVSGISVKFTAPTSGPSAIFAGSTAATVATNANGIASAPTLTANSQSGSYSIVASIAGLSATANFALTNNPAPNPTPSNGSLSGSVNDSTATINLTSEGGLDWIHWGDNSTNRKVGVTPQISDYTTVGSGPVMTYSNDPRPISWTDGSPLAASSSNQNGVYVNFIGNGFSFTAPADGTVRTLTVHVGGWMSGGTLTAHLSDSSAPDYVNITPSYTTQYDRNYTLVYSAASPGQKITITWVDSASGGNVTLNGAALH